MTATMIVHTAHHLAVLTFLCLPFRRERFACCESDDFERHNATTPQMQKAARGGRAHSLSLGFDSVSQAIVCFQLHLVQSRCCSSALALQNWRWTGFINRPATRARRVYLRSLAHARERGRGLRVDVVHNSARNTLPGFASQVPGIAGHVVVDLDL